MPSAEKPKHSLPPEPLLRAFDRFRSGEIEAFTVIHAATSPRLCRFATGMLGANDAEDIVQDVFIKLFRSINKVERESCVAWLFRVTRNECLQCLKRRRNRREVGIGQPHGDEDDDEHPDARGCESPEATAMRAEEDDLIRLALDDLSEEDREVLVLRGEVGLSYSAIAEVIECQDASVYAKLRSAGGRFVFALKARGVSIREAEAHLAAWLDYNDRRALDVPKRKRGGKQAGDEEQARVEP